MMDDRRETRARRQKSMEKDNEGGFTGRIDMRLIINHTSMTPIAHMSLPSHHSSLRTFSGAR